MKRPDAPAAERVGVWFCAILAVAMIAVRLSLFEACLFGPTCIPNHDMGQGLTFFGTSIHNLRLTGDIVWWNPISREGYAQYFQSFLSPLAPTPHHVTFISWAILVRLLALLHVGLPSEYLQYVAFNYLLLPFLAYLALGELARALFRHWGAVVLVVGTFALSSIGIWNAAWFYFQESFSLFFLLATFVRAVQRPGRGELALLAAAILVQVSSLNYWTIYNVVFIVLFLGTYVAFHPGETRECLASVAKVLRKDRATRVVAALVLATATVWLVLTASIAREQTGRYLRTNAGESAATRVKGVRTFTVELWNPGIEIALENYPARFQGGQEPPIHNARYLGVSLLPLLLLSPFVRWKRRTGWLIPLLVAMFVLCLAPRFLTEPVSRIPYLNQIQHLFYFYTAHLQLVVALVAAAVWDGALEETDDAAARRVRRGSFAVLALSLLAAGVAWRLGAALPGVDRHGLYYVRAFGLAVGASLTLSVLLHVQSTVARVGLSLVLLGVHLADLGAYFRHGSRIDQAYTSAYWHVAEPLEESLAEHLRQPMPDPDPRLGATAGLERGLGVHDHFWPANDFMIPATHRDFDRHPQGTADAPSGEPFDFFPQGEHPVTEPLVLSHRADLGASPWSARWVRWGYNAFSVSVTVPRDGWLFLLRTYDPLWHFRVDDRETAARASNYIGTALRLGPGTHEVSASYRPFARRLYRLAAAALLGLVALLLHAGAQRRRDDGALTR